MPNGSGDAGSDARALEDALDEALAELPDEGHGRPRDAMDYRWLRAGLRVGVERPERARRLLELIGHQAADPAADPAEPREGVSPGPSPVASPAAADPGGPPPTPIRSSLLARAAALRPSERESLGPEVRFGWVEMLTPDEILLFGRTVHDMVAAGSPRDLGRGFGLAWDAGVRVPHSELEAMLREFTELEVTVAGVLVGRELRTAGEPAQRSRGVTALFDSWVRRKVPGESQAGAALERSGEAGQSGLVALWNVWMAMRYRAALPRPTFDLMIRPWVAIVGPLPES